MREIIPTAKFTRRMTEGGRIRIGKKKGNRPTSIGTFRFTSRDAEAIHQLAEHYGGTPQPWSGGHGGQWEVESDADEVRVVLPPDPLGGSPVYELWSGGGCQRRCDGVTAQVPISGGEIAEMQEVGCLCDSKQVMECKPKTRLNLILPDIKFSGVWRLETSSWNAAQELPGMVDTIQMLQEQSLTRGLLALEKRQSKSGGQTRNFVVPVLRLDTSLDAAVTGMAQVAHLGQAADPKPALSAPSVDVVGNPEEGDSPPAPPLLGDSVPTPPEEDREASSGGDRAALTRRAHALFRDLDWDYDTQVRPALEKVYGKTLSKLDDESLLKFTRAISDEDSAARFAEHFDYVVEAEDE